MKKNSPEVEPGKLGYISYLVRSTAMTPEDFGITIIAVIIGVMAAWFFARWYYMKGSKDMEGLENMNLATFRIIQDGNLKEGKLFKGNDGKWHVEWTRAIAPENVTVGSGLASAVRNGDKDES